MKYAFLIWSGIWYKRSRSLLTLLSLAVAFTLVGTLQGVNAGFAQGIAGANINRLFVTSSISFTEPLPYSDLELIKRVPGVTGVTYASFFRGYFQNPKNPIFAMPIEPTEYFDLYPEYKISAEAVRSLEEHRTGAIIGAVMARKYGWKVGDRVPLVAANWVRADGAPFWGFDIVGIFDDPSDPSAANFFLFNANYFDEIRATSKGTVGWFIVRVADPKSAAQVSQNIDRLFANSPDETRTQSEKDFVQAVLLQIGDVNFLVSAILYSVFFTLLFVTGNTMMQSVRERIPEFAVLRTIGYSDAALIGIVLIESVSICICGAVVGLALAEAMFPAMQSVIGIATLPVQVVLWSAAAAVVLGIVVALPPALRIKRLDVVSILTGH